MTKTTKYNIGAPCWLLDGVLLYNVTITEAKVFLEGGVAEFTMYRVKSADYDFSYRWINPASLFLRPAHVAQLRAEVEERKRELDYVLREIGEVVS